MLTFFILFVLGFTGFSHGAAIEHDSGNVGIELMIPRGQTRAEYLQSIIDYWTPERMASAIPKDLTIRDENELLHLNNHPKAERAATVLVNSALLSDMVSTKPLVAVVNANNRDTAITAGHCIFDFDNQIWASNWVFVPNYEVGSRPVGTFTMRQMATKTEWMNSRDFNYDVGIVLMNTNEAGQHIQDVAGGLGITLDAPRQGSTTSFGYPKNINSGEIVSYCSGIPLSPTFLLGFTGLQLSCGMTGGSSGGPWIQNYDVDAPAGQQISVNSFIVTGRPYYLFGPYFTEDNIGSLYRAYQDQ